MKIVFMGTPDFAVPTLKMLHENHEVLLVVTQPDREVGRKRIKQPSPVKILAIELGIPVIQPDHLRDEEHIVIDLKPDFIVTAAYGQMLSKHLLEQVPALNVHGSLLPKYRGGAPIQYALFDGMKETGVTVMYMANQMDSGDIIKQEKVMIRDQDDAHSLMLRMREVGASLLKDVLTDISQNKIDRIPQDIKDVTFAYTIKRQDEFINFNQTARDIINRIRGLAPEPGASAIFENKTIKFFKAKTSDIIESKEKPGTIIDLDKRFVIQAKDGAIEILEILVPGKKRMDIQSFLNGQTLFKMGDRFHKGEE